MDFEYKGKHYEICTLKDEDICVVFDTAIVIDEDDEDEEEGCYFKNEVVDWFYIDRDDIVAEAKERLDWLESQKK